MIPQPPLLQLKMVVGKRNFGGEQTDHRTTTDFNTSHQRFRYGRTRCERVGRDAGLIAEEIIQHLSVIPGAKVTVTLEIDAHVSQGIPDKTMRIVNENCQTLKFKNHGFEEE